MSVSVRAFITTVIFLTAVTYVEALPSFDQIRKAYRKSDAVLLDRHGNVIHELRVDAKGRRLAWTGLKDISPALVRAVLHSEDRRFYEHGGVDWNAAATAAIKNLFSGERRGASTVTMQLAAILDRDLRPRAKKRDLAQKWEQMQAAREIEGSWKKEDILEAYLNLVTYRGEIQGIAAASRGLFNKDASGLDELESLILASLIRAPNALPEDVARRACRLRESMGLTLSCAGFKTLAEQRLQGPFILRQEAALAPHVAHALLKSSPASVSITLDGNLQRFVAETIKYHLSSIIKQNARDGAVLVVDNETGDILAYVASSGDISAARHVDGISARRQAGSTLKPFLYALAFERKLLTPVSILNDSPLDVPTALGVYRPENYDNEFKGPVPSRIALASSLNVPAVRTLSLTGVDSFVAKLGELGFRELNAGDFYGYSLALGTADVTLYELVNAYRTLANRGVWSELRIQSGKAVKKRRVYSEITAYQISDILSDREARSLTFGLENSLATRFWTAAKTGTSKDMRDNWCVGFSEKYTVGVWVGNFNGEPMWNVSGVTGAAPVWQEIMNYLHAGTSSRPPKMPEGMIRQTMNGEVVAASKHRPFIKGTEPVPARNETALRPTPSVSLPRIIYPAQGMIIAIDPDIPEDLQRVFFESDVSHDGIRWRLNDAELGRTSEIISWKPVTGTYTISIMDAGNAIIDSVYFKVKGN